MPFNNPTQSFAGQNQAPANIPAKNFIRQNTKSTNNLAVTQYPMPINNSAGKNQMPSNNPTQNFISQNQIPTKYPTQNVTGQNQVLVNINAKNSIRQNTIPTNNLGQNFVTQYPIPLMPINNFAVPVNIPAKNPIRQNTIPTNNLAQNFVAQCPMPINNFVGKNYLPNGFIQNKAFKFTQQPFTPFTNGNRANFTSAINCPLIQRCHEVKERYEEEYGNLLGYHAGFGDIKGLRHHFTYGANVNGIFRFTNTMEHLVIIAAKYCNSRWKLIEIFKLLKEYNANFKYVSRSTGKIALHYLYENSSFTRELNDHIGLQKFHLYMKETIEFLVNNGCDINAKENFKHTILSYYLCDRFRHKEYAPIILFLLKKGANPNIPSGITAVSPYNAPNALFLAVKIGWPIEVLNGLLDYGAKGDIKDHHGENLLVLAAREKQSAAIDLILETIPEASASDCIDFAMKLLDKKDRNKLSKWKGPEGEIKRRLIQENLELKRQLRTINESL
ncbi:20306_t:CDS:2 [Dentiscutata erythropus]|uniref:20306_t:CDS:1 n=1 Tax=Dentiscutata erythropus TaxID=1348616 RepID=A0A9N9DTI5_9GLOM|nr:20306_t:CDS:2 [Dentiscutata erythropus]